MRNTLSSKKIALVCVYAVDIEKRRLICFDLLILVSYLTNKRKWSCLFVNVKQLNKLLLCKSALFC